MIRETLQQVQAKIENSDSLKSESKMELLNLLSALQTEIENLSKTDVDHAESIVSLAQVSAHESTRKEKNPRLHKLSLEALAASVEGFDASHPRLVQLINSICTSLSNLGI